MRNLLAALVFAISLPSAAQITPGKISFALPEHSGRLTLDQGKFDIKELSAKPNGHEFGVRAEEGDLKFLGFLFVWPEKPNLSSETCRDEMLKSEGAESLAADQGRSSYTTPSGVHIAMVLLIPKNFKSSGLRAFVAKDDLCADLLFTYMQPPTKKMFPMDESKAILNTIVFEPIAKPMFREAFAYATLEWDHQQLKGAATAYADALKLVDQSDDPLKWRRVTTDQLSMALGMSGDLKQSRAVNEAAIELDPIYPMYYYDLACADAEEGNAAAARVHLEQAYARSANTLPGEKLPDPATDDSIQKLKGNHDFWAFVQTLSSKTKS